jgi:DNA-binding FadR family transcriptional regulator
MGQFLVFVSERVRESILAAGNQQKSDDMARITLGEHERIFAAIRDGDGEAAQAAMRDHLAGAALRVGLHEGEVPAEVPSPARHSRLRKAVRGQAAG